MLELSVAMRTGILRPGCGWTVPVSWRCRDLFSVERDFTGNVVTKRGSLIQHPRGLGFGAVKVWQSISALMDMAVFVSRMSAGFWTV